ncbi:MAG: hypothetical protein M3R24_36740 [Chloroflexota bacterium]|nr:hypothetical protein [Chloroflexota bacterium]
MEPALRFRALFWASIVVIGVGIVGPVYLTTIRTDGALTADIFCLVVLMTGGSLYYLALTIASVRSARLVVSPNKLEHHMAGITFVTPWSNVKALREGRWETVLVLDRPAQSTYGKLFTYLPGDKVRRLNNRAIPLSNYGWSVSSQLRADIQKYAPHLFQEDQ